MDLSDLKIVESAQNQILLNPSLENELKIQLETIAKNHTCRHPMIWIMSSGSSSTFSRSYKLIGLSREALLASANAVNQHLKSTSADRWLNVLPLFHVGGLSILYRSYLSFSKCINLWNAQYRWNPVEFLNECREQLITLTSLVPTQVFDLVQMKVAAPTHLRAIVVGGARLNEDLYIKARALGWPVLPSFGMTEVASQIATASLGSLSSSENSYPSLRLLSHIIAKTDEAERLLISGPSLMEGYYTITDGSKTEWIDGRNVGDWFQTQDCVTIENDTLLIHSRTDEVIKVRGENVNLATLRNRLETLLNELNQSQESTIIALPDERTGSKLVLIGKPELDTLRQVAKVFNAQVLPFERIERLFGTVELPRTPLGKISQSQLLEIANSRLSSEL